MTWEQKLQACKAIGDVSLNMRKPGDWYVDQSFNKSEGSLLKAGCVTGAKTPEEAINQFWQWASTGVMKRSYRSEPLYVRWNGFMWENNGVLAGGKMNNKQEFTAHIRNFSIFFG